MIKFIKSKYFKQVTIFLAAILLMFNVMPGISKASKIKDINNELFSSLNQDLQITIMKFTDEEIIYKAAENGNIYLYEEHIIGDVVSTNKYKLDGSKKELVESFNTTANFSNDGISVIQEDLLNSQILSDSFVEILATNDISKDNSVSALASETWVQASAAGFNYAYTKNSKGGGKAREMNFEKSVPSYNKAFDSFTDDVDSMKAFEVGLLKDLLFIGVLDQAFKSIKNPTVANITEFLKKYLKSLPGVAVIVAVVQYFNLVNKVIDSYEDIPGTEYTWR